MDAQKQPDERCIAVPAAANSTSVRFDTDTAIAYAEKYSGVDADHPYNYDPKGGLFASNSEDCQNFLSQIVWAGYGGWTENDSVATIKANIKSRYRMYYNGGDYSTAWYENQGSGSSAWENVSGHWNFLNNNGTYGPKARLYYDETLNTRVPASDIFVGNGVQVRNGSSGGYDHSVFIVSHTANPYVLSTIGYAAHTTDYYDEPLTTTIAAHGGQRIAI